MKRTYKLPNGTETTNTDTYIDTWHAFAEPICKRTGLTLLAFDPDIVIGTPNGSRQVRLPVWFVEKLRLSL